MNGTQSNDEGNGTKDEDCNRSVAARGQRARLLSASTTEHSLYRTFIREMIDVVRPIEWPWVLVGFGVVADGLPGQMASKTSVPPRPHSKRRSARAATLVANEQMHDEAFAVGCGKE